MKVIAKVSESRFLCEIREEELERFLNLYYGKMEKMTVGKEYDLSKSFELDRSIADATKKLESIVDEAHEITSSLKSGKVIRNKLKNI